MVRKKQLVSKFICYSIYKAWVMLMQMRVAEIGVRKKNRKDSKKIRPHKYQL